MKFCMFIILVSGDQFCPVKMFNFYESKRPVNMLQEES